MNRRTFLQVSAGAAGGCSCLLFSCKARRSEPAVTQTESSHHLIQPRFDPITVQASPGQIEILSTNGFALRNCRPYLAWRFPGESTWRESVAAELKDLHTSAEDVSLASQFQFLRADVRLAKKRNDVWEVSGTLKNNGDRTVELARFHYLQGEVAPQVGFLTLQGNNYLDFVRSGAAVPSYKSEFEAMWRSMHVRWPVLSDPIHDRPNWALSKDTAAFIPDYNKPGWGFGFTGPGTAFGEIGFNTKSDPSRFFLGVLLDNIVLDPGESRELEKALLWCGDWQEGLKEWARACAQEFHAPKAKPPLVGWCSWYQAGQGVRAEDVIRANEEFAKWPLGSGGRLVQIDDGYQVKPGDWSPNEKFADIWAGLPAQIAKTGGIPATYLAPLTIHESHPIVKEHPEWLQRLPNGEFAVWFSNWGGKTYYLEPDHPEAKAFIRRLFQQTVAGGWKYIKIDFTYGVSTARVAYDRKKTYFQTQRDLYALFREAAGPNILLNACVGEPARYALGHAEAARLGGDTGTNWAVVRGNLRHLLPWGCTNGTWWQGDPDVFYMRQENSKLTEEENYLLTGTLGLFGGVFLTSDFPSQWSPAAQAAVREFWTETGPRVPSDYRVLWDEDGQVRAYRVSYADGKTPQHQVGLYNWDDKAQDIRIPLAEVGLKPDISWQLATTPRNQSAKLADKYLVVEAQPAHSLRIAGLVESKS